MAVLQFGTTGQVGIELRRQAAARGLSVVALSRADVDVADVSAIAAAIDGTPAIDAVVNATAYTAVDQAESDPATAYAINERAVAAMAEGCARRGVPLVHISTDYVYDGAKPDAYVEIDLPRPQSTYGASKLAGERAIESLCPRHVIVRTAWVYSPHGRNFVKTMLRLGQERDELTVVDDQRGCPTSAGDLAAALLSILNHVTTDGAPVWGVYHYAGADETTWRRFADAILAGAKDWLPIEAGISPIPTSAYPTPAKRPANSVLDCQKIERTFGIRPRPWPDGLKAVLQELRNATEHATEEVRS